MQDIRPSPIAGRWYPGDAQRLAASIDRYLDQADVQTPDGAIRALMVPHAGHQYSGQVAAHAFKLIQSMDFDIVALVGPSHHPFDATVITSGHAAYATPLGEIAIAQELVDALRKHIAIEPVRNDAEHSLEIELPFLQRTLGSFRLIPLALLDQSWTVAQQLGRALATVLAGRNALLIASSDLSHFYPQTVAHTLDHVVLNAVAAFDPAAVIDAEKQGKGFACGRGAIATVMVAAKLLGADAAQVVNYATSGDVLGDHRQVVGYGAAVFYQAFSS